MEEQLGLSLKSERGWKSWLWILFRDPVKTNLPHFGQDTILMTMLLLVLPSARAHSV
jgi:hypothetical protein